MRYVDSFGAPIPSFNLRGETHATTRIGGFLTVSILTLTLAFAVQTLFAIFTGSDPTINRNIKTGHYDDEIGLNLNSAN